MTRKSGPFSWHGYGQLVQKNEGNQPCKGINM
jgi:hypothetical protein